VFGEEKKFSLENRLFLSAIVFGILISINGAILSSIISPSKITLIICLILAFILLLLYYFIRFKGVVEPFKIPMIVISFLGISTIWVFDGGMNGSDLMVGFVALILSLIGVSEKQKNYVITLFVTLVVIIYLIQLYRPDLIVAIPSEKNRWIDSLITALYCSIFIFLIIRFLHNNFIKERQRAEESEKKYKELFEANTDSITIFSIREEELSPQILDMNENAAKMLGYTKEEMIAINPNDLEIGLTQDKLNKRIEDLKTKGISNFETIFRHKKGYDLHCEVKAMVINYNNKPEILNIARDITKRKKTEAELYERETKYHDLYTLLRLMSDTMPDMLWAKDLNNRYIFANKALCENILSASDTSEPIGKTDLFFAQRERDLHPNEPNWHTFGEICADTDTITLHEMKKMQFDEYGNVRNTFLFLDVHKAPLFDVEGNLIGVVGSGRDVTRQKLAEEELIRAKVIAEESEEKFRLMLKNSNDTFVLINEKGEQVYISDAALRDTGYSIEELKGPIQNVIYPADLGKVIDAFNEVLSKKGDVIRVQYRHKHKYKKYIWYEAAAQNFIDNPAIKAVVVNVRDITAIKETEKELIKAKEKAEESDRLKTAFLQNMSHEIRTPMNAIMGFSSLLVKNYNNQLKLEKFSTIINQRCNDLLDIINDILDISKIESGQLPVNREECNLTDLFTELLNFFYEYQNRIGKQHIHFSLKAHCNKSDNIIITDKGKLKQIFINLISNAFKFTETGTIEGGCKYDSNHNLVFYLTDTGIGIPPDKQNVVFERFAQLHQGDVRNIGGTGLGLSIVKGLVNLLGGDIFLDSGPNKGCSFSFTIPYIASQVLQVEPIITEPLYSNNIRNKVILIVEDDRYNAEYLKEILSDNGLNILLTDNGREAIEICLSKAIDLVLMDIRLPDMNGYEAAKEIRKHKPHLKVIAQTAYAAQDEKQKAFDAGCCDYVSKPTRQDLLLSVLSKHLS